MSVRIGINPITWVNDDDPSLGGDTTLETILTEMHQAGFAGSRKQVLLRLREMADLGAGPINLDLQIRCSASWLAQAEDVLAAAALGVTADDVARGHPACFRNVEGEGGPRMLADDPFGSMHRLDRFDRRRRSIKFRRDDGQQPDSA